MPAQAQAHPPFASAPVSRLSGVSFLRLIADLWRADRFCGGNYGRMNRHRGSRLSPDGDCVKNAVRFPRDDDRMQTHAR
jgi:hypothetical protein